MNLQQIEEQCFESDSTSQECNSINNLLDEALRERKTNGNYQKK